MCIAHSTVVTVGRADEKANLRVAERLLTKCGVSKGNVVLLASGESGVAHLSALPPDEHTHTVVLLDINLGTMTGFDVMAMLPSPPPFPVIACTSYVSVDDQEQYISSNFSGLLGKPYTATHLARLLKGVVAQSRPPFLAVTGV